MTIQAIQCLLRRSFVAGLVAAGVAACAGLWTAASHAAPPQKGYGTIKGRLVWAGANVPKPQPLTVNKDVEVCGKAEHVDRSLLVDPKTKGVANAFAYLNRPTGQNPDALKALLDRSSEAVIDQKVCEFQPYSTAMHQDQKLIFKSSDPLNHNVRFTAFKNNPFNQILPPNGKAELKLVAENRPLPLACDIHPWMKGAIMVFDHPFFAITKEDGSFEIEGVPPGTQNLVVRLANGKFQSAGAGRGMPVKVEADKVTDVGEIQAKP